MKRWNGARHERGFTLIELLVVVALFSIILTYSVSSYRQYVQRANRTDATALLLRVGAAQERFYLDNNRYAQAADEPGFDAPISEHGHYELNILPGPSGDAALDYIATATPVDGGDQADDADCRELSITEAGVRGSRPKDPDTCWE